MENDTTIYTENSIRTYTGKVFDLKIMDPETICIEDIAHALAYVNRFAGHLKKPLSVGQHSINVAFTVRAEHQLAALLHDASEAYIGDMPSPFKKMMPDYKEIEHKLMTVIAQKFGFQYPLHQEVKDADARALNHEWRTRVLENIDSQHIMNPESVKEFFLGFYNQLIKESNP